MSLARPAPFPVVALLWAETRPVVQAIFALRYWMGATLAAAGSGQFGPAVVGAAAARATAGREPEVLLPAVLLALGACAVAGCALVTPGDAARPLMRRPYRAFMVTQYAVNPALLLSVLL